jgi:hypothetical protein
LLFSPSPLSSPIKGEEMHLPFKLGSSKNFPSLYEDQYIKKDSKCLNVPPYFLSPLMVGEYLQDTADGSQDQVTVTNV